MKGYVQETLAVESISTAIMDTNSKIINVILVNQLDTKPQMFAKQSSVISNRNLAINNVNKYRRTSIWLHQWKFMKYWKSLRSSPEQHKQKFTLGSRIKRTRLIINLFMMKMVSSLWLKLIHFYVAWSFSQHPLTSPFTVLLWSWHWLFLSFSLRMWKRTVRLQRSMST